MKLHFDKGRTLTHDATNFVLPAGGKPPEVNADDYDYIDISYDVVMGRRNEVLDIINLKTTIRGLP